MGPVDLDYVKLGVISQLRCVFFLEKGLEVPTEQRSKAAQGPLRAALVVTPDTSKR